MASIIVDLVYPLDLSPAGLQNIHIDFCNAFKVVCRMALVSNQVMLGSGTEGLLRRAAQRARLPRAIIHGIRHSQVCKSFSLCRPESRRLC